MRYLFVGNRVNVLNAMILEGLDLVGVFCEKSSAVEKFMVDRSLPYNTFSSKESLISLILSKDFDILLSNGCSYILPVSKIRKDHQKFINIHPSLLPDLRGKSPINGAILFNREHGVTCHLMDDGIDTGATIAQVGIPISRDTDLGLLYKLSFLAEKDVFLSAYRDDFKSIDERIIENLNDESIYYSRNNEDMMINWDEDANTTIRRIKAFGVKNLCAKFTFKNELFSVYDCEIIENLYFNEFISNYKHKEVVFLYDWTIIIRLHDLFLKLKGVRGSLNRIHEGDMLD